MKTRKLVLLIACAALLVVCILQGVLKGSDKVKNYELKETPDQLVVSTPEEKFTIASENGTWVLGDKKYAANESTVNSMVDAISSIKVLDKVAVANNDSVIARYELSDEKAVTVTAKKGDKVLRTVTMGKTSTASSQNYVLIDGSKDVYLATGNLNSALNKKISDLRSHAVLSLTKADIASVRIKAADGSADFAISRTGSGDDVSWYINQPDVVVDGKKAADWFDSLASVSTPVWHDDGDLKGDLVENVEIRAGNKTVTMDIYKTQKDDGSDLYYGYSSETPYQFELASYSVQKFQKTPDDFVQ